MSLQLSPFATGTTPLAAPSTGRDTLILVAACSAALAAIGAMLYAADLHVLGALLGLPGWMACCWLLGWRLRLRGGLAALLLLQLCSQLMLLVPTGVTGREQLLLALISTVAYAGGWTQRRLAAAYASRRAQADELRLYSFMLSSSDECVKLIRPDGTLMAINPQGLRLLSASSAADLIGHNWLEFWGAPERRQAEEAFAEALAGRSATFFGMAPTLTGEMRHWRNRIVTVPGPGGEVRLLCISNDITVSVEAELALERRRQQLLQVVDALDKPLLAVNSDWQVTFASRQALQLLGAQTEVLHVPLRDILPLQSGDLERCIQRARSTTEPQQCRLYWPERMLWLGVTALSDAQEITLLLENLSGANACPAPSADHEQIRLLREVSGIGDWLFSAGDGKLALSAAALAVLDLPAQSTAVDDERRGDGGADRDYKKAALELLHPDDRPALLQAILRSVDTGELLDLTLRRLDALAPGGMRYLHWRACRIEAGSDTRLLGVLRDVTAERAAEVARADAQSLLGDVLDTLPLEIVVFDSSGTVITINRTRRDAEVRGGRREAFALTVGANYLESLTVAFEAQRESGARHAAQRRFEGLRAVMQRDCTSFECDFESGTNAYRAHFIAVADSNLTISATEDITKTRELSSAIAAHDQRLAQAMNATQDGVWVWSQASGSTFYSNQFAALLQYPIADLPAFDALLRTTTHPADRARVETQLAELNPPVDRYTFALEVRLLVGSTSFRWFRLRGEVQRRSATEVQIAGSVMDIQDERDLRQKLYDVAFRDEITLLPNRKALYERLEQDCADDTKPFALLLVDLDRFKNVNTTLGVGIGDDLLRQVAKRMQDVVSEPGLVARLGADEFAVILPIHNESADLGVRIEYILESLRPVFRLDGQEAFITASIGVVRCPQDGHTADDLLRFADVALRSAKQAGRNGFQFFEHSGELPGRERLALETELRQALARNEFELFYQGKFALRDDSLMGAEALLRWHSQGRGLVSPAEFIPLLEETGLILSVGEWVLREACRQVAEWHAATGRWLSLAVNVSTIQLAANDFAQTAIRILHAQTAHGTHIPPQIIELEITESALMADIENGAQLLKTLKLAGFSIALDDFGTGYSSLGYLRRFSPHTLKMDRSFIADLEQDVSAREIAAGIVQLARALSIDVVAEGIETTAQRDILRGMRCPIGQGFLFAKPLSVADFEQRLLQRQDSRVVTFEKKQNP